MVFAQGHLECADGVSDHLSIGVGRRIDGKEDLELLLVIFVEIKTVFDMVNPQGAESIGTELVKRLAYPAEAGGAQKDSGRIGIVDSKRDDLVDRSLGLARIGEGGAAVVIRPARGASSKTVIDQIESARESWIELGRAEIAEGGGGAVVIDIERIARVGERPILAVPLTRPGTGSSIIVAGGEIFIGAVIDPHTGIDGEGPAGLIPRPPRQTGCGEEKEN